MLVIVQDEIVNLNYAAMANHTEFATPVTFDVLIDQGTNAIVKCFSECPVRSYDSYFVKRRRDLCPSWLPLIETHAQLGLY